MKKIFYLLAACLMMTFGCISECNAQNAQKKATTSAAASLIGTWVTDARNYNSDIPEQFNKADVLFTFTQNSLVIGFDFSGSVNEDKIQMNLGVKVESDFSYTKRGKTITFASKGLKPRVNVYKCNLIADAQTKAAMKLAGIDDATVKNMMSTEMQKNDWNNMFNDANGTLTITTLNTTTLALTDESGKQITFKRKK